MKTVGVFDSGVGGLSVTNAIKKALPEQTVLYFEDSKNIPYGTKSKKELYELVVPIIKRMAKQCDVIVIACNTVSTTLISELRQITSVPIIAMEPMIESAARVTKTNVIAVCATPTTLASKRYAWLVETYAKHLTVLEPDCSTWSSMIETNKVNEQLIRETIEEECRKGADTIVLGCTHYHWIEDLIKEIAGKKVKVLQPEEPTILQLAQVL